MPEFDFKWSTNPPVEQVKRAKLISLQLKHDIGNWSDGLDDPAEERNGVPTKGVIKSALQMAQMIYDGDHSGSDIFTYKVCGRPVAILILKLYRTEAYINDIVVHPGVEFGGPTMIEFALNHCVKNGVPPRLELWPLNDNSKPAYLGMGFVDYINAPKSDPRSGHFWLEAESSSKWESLNGVWRYKSSRPMGKKYLESTPR